MLKYTFSGGYAKIPRLLALPHLMDNASRLGIKQMAYALSGGYIGLFLAASRVSMAAMMSGGP
jgi:hypothetical protein